MDNYTKLMKKCISLAKKGNGYVSPNPLVGCVVLNNKGEIISTGYHHKYGENHAERDALLKLKHGEEKGGTIIVNLEPCSHFGKTPPCVDLIIERGLKKVVIGTIDYNAKVNGKGIQKLKDANIDVVVGILEKECIELNRKFFKDINEHKVYIGLKTATTIDGKIATRTKNSKWITTEKTRNYAKKIRKEYDAILTTSQTVIDDNPKMKHNIKVVVDTNLKSDLSSMIFKSGKIILAVGENIKTTNLKLKNNIKILKCKTQNKHIDLNNLFEKLYNMGIKSIFIEAGGKFCGQIIKNNMADEIYHFVAPKIINDNSALSCFDGDNVIMLSDAKKFKISSIKKIDDDVLIVYRRLSDK